MVVPRVVKVVGMYFALSIVATGILLLYAAPYHPKSLSGWALFFLLSLPVLIAGEVLGKYLWENPFARKLDKKTAGKEVSWLRMLYTFFVVLVFLGLTLGVMAFLGLQ